MSYSAIDAYSDICTELDSGPVGGESEDQANTRVVEAFYKMQKEHLEMQRILAGRTPAGPELIARARANYGTDEIAVDDDAERSESNDESGTWVSAWVWVQE